MPHDLLAGKNDEVGLASTGCRTRIRTLTKGSKVPCATVTPSGIGAMHPRIRRIAPATAPLAAARARLQPELVVPKAGVEQIGRAHV